MASPVASRGLVWLLWEASGAVLDVTMGWLGASRGWVGANIGCFDANRAGGGARSGFVM